MSRPILTIDPLVLADVTGGSQRPTSSNIDGLLNQLNSITSSLKDITTKTNGLGTTEMMMLCVLALQQRPANVVYVSSRRIGWW